MFSFTSILNIADVEVKKLGRVPITLIVYNPIGFSLETNISPVAESTLIKSIPSYSICPS